eukprot:TRINITY_DN59582_c0_g1_i1.p2 TRINITY_DN59582_c0_g1~~TRINITY_DN59582_c0_g1_i1.p2  ORF type:complete len:374 (-),score=100.26 TRINITY_DN59582_c0_g1_i1:106-1176(-)
MALHVSRNPAMAGTSQDNWVPDDEVKECPFCSKTFSLVARKHHCRVCGRVVCGGCSSKQVNGERACDTCYEIHQGDPDGTLIEKRSQHRMTEASLKEDLKKKLEQSAWFTNLLVRIEAEAKANGVSVVPPATSSTAQPAAESKNAAASGAASGEQSPAESTNPFQADAAAAEGDAGEARQEDASPDASTSFASSGGSGPPRGQAAKPEDCLDSEIIKLIDTAREQWQAACQEKLAFEKEARHVQEENEALQSKILKGTGSIAELKRNVRGMELELRGQAEIEADRDMKQAKVEELRRELAGLQARCDTLQARVGSRSFMSVGGGSNGESNSRSFLMAATPRAGQCVERTRERCVVM